MKIFRFLSSLIAAMVIGGAALAATVTPIPLLTGPQDPSQLNASINTLISQINANYPSLCTVTGSAGTATCNGTAGIVTTESLTTAHNAVQSYAITDSSVTSSSIVLCQVNGYSGTVVTNGVPVITQCVPTTSTITAKILNADPTNALSGTVVIAFRVLY